MSIAKRLKDEVDARRMNPEQADALLMQIHRNTARTSDEDRYTGTNEKPDAMRDNQDPTT